MSKSLRDITKVYRNNQYIIADVGRKMTKKETDVFIAERGVIKSITASNNDRTVFFSDNEYAFADFASGDKALAYLKEKYDRSKAVTPRGLINRVIVPDGEALYPYQKVAVEYLIDGDGGLVAEGVGLGKTCIALAYANWIYAKKVLLVVPANLKLQWERNVRKWTLMHKPIIQVMKNTSQGINPFANYVILSYESTRNIGILKAIGAQKWDLLIADEAHRMKTPDSTLTRAMLGNEKGVFKVAKGDNLAPVINHAKRKVFLTGTPIMNRPLEIYTQARALDWSSIDFMTFEKFKSHYNLPPVFGKRGADEEIIAREMELQNRLRTHFMVRHNKNEVLPQIKKPRHALVYVEPDGKVKEALEAESALGLTENDVLNKNYNIEVAGHIAEARRLMGEAIAPLIVDHALDFLESGEKLFIACWHKSVVDIFCEKLSRYNPIKVVGGMTDKQKDDAVMQFINRKDHRVIVGNAQAAGVGVDGIQQVCSDIWLAESSWNPADNEQVVGRVDRLGQRSVVNASYFVAPDSLSEKLLSKVMKKVLTNHKVLDKTC